MSVRYPTRQDWLRLLESPAVWQGPADEILIGTIADLLQLAEEHKKGRAQVDLTTFLHQWDALMEGPLVPAGTLQVLELDLDSLRDAMFDVDINGGEIGVRFWSEVADTDTPPWHTLRRLVLRPLEHRWFGDEPYRQMEAQAREESDRDG